MPRSLLTRCALKFRPVTNQERRQFLKRTLATSSGLLLSQGMSPTLVAGQDSRRRIAVIGAGFSGLVAAHELLAVGHDVVVLDARNRIGGRVLSANEQNRRPFIKGMNIELGGELIGSNHAAWVQFADHFGLEFQELGEDDADLPVVLDGQRLSSSTAERMWEELDESLTQLNPLAETIREDTPWDSPNATELDGQSVHDWIKRLEVMPLVRRALWTSFSADNGRDASQQSLLGLLAAIKGGGVARYWTESEVYRCRGGNDQLAAKLSEALGGERLLLRTPVVRVSYNGERMEIETAAGRKLECDNVVLTAPPSTWHKLKLDPALPSQLKPQMGLNAKYFAVVTSRFWEEEGLSQYALADDGLQMTWDGTDGQGAIGSGSSACLVGFAGGSVCERASLMSPAEREQWFAQQLEVLFPGFKQHMTRGFYMNWPQESWAGGGYSFPAPGQVTSMGPLLIEPHMDGRLHIGGEHTCYKFVGFMEGALQSGLRIARAIAAV